MGCQTFAALAQAFEIVGSHFVGLEVSRLLAGLENVVVEPERDLDIVGERVVCEWRVAGQKQRLRWVVLGSGEIGYLLGIGRGVAFYAEARIVRRTWARRGPRFRKAWALDGEAMARRRAGR